MTTATANPSPKIKDAFDRRRADIGMFLGPALMVLLLFFPLPGLPEQAQRLAAVMALVIVFWATEAIPIPVTALLGVALAVVFGVAPAAQVLASFGDPVIFVFIGSFILALGMQEHGVDRRIAYALLAHPWVGGSTWRTVWALGLTAWLLSMWISNTATVAMLFPVALAMGRAGTDLLPASSGARPALAAPRYVTCLLLMLAYAGSLGGIATPIGTPPNLIGIALIQQHTGTTIGFVRWMCVGLPAAAFLLVVSYVIVMLSFRPEMREVPEQQARVRAALQALGPWTPGQRNSVVAFVTAILLWTGPGLLALALGSGHPLALMAALRMPEGVAALLAASLLFVLPVDWKQREFTLRWEQAIRIDWGTVLMFGGGIALGRMMFETGLALATGQALVRLAGAESFPALAATAVVAGSLISEASSNTASANMVVPVMLSMADAAGVAGPPLGLAATLGASMGFMLPVSTPPNAIVYGTGAVRLRDMVKSGILLDLTGGVVVWTVAVWLAPRIFA